MRRKVNPWLPLFAFAWIGLSPLLHAEEATRPKFRRALILSGGGFTPAVGIGILAGVRAAGWEPDVIITTCGASMAAAIANQYPDQGQDLAFAESPAFFGLLQRTQLRITTVFGAGSLYDALMGGGQTVPNLFNSTILSFPESIEGSITAAPFSSDPKRPRIIMLSARAHFGPTDVGTRFPEGSRFTQVYFTDPETALRLEGLESPIKHAFPESFLDPRTEVITDVLPDQAARASIADPLLINPAKIRGSYYFTGAVDLRPVEMALRLADEVVATYPYARFTDYEEKTIVGTFGFSPRVRTLQTIAPENIRWIDLAGLPGVSFDPRPVFLNILSRIPETPKRFAAGIRKQFNFGFERGKEAIDVQKSRSARSHLRALIQPDCRNPEEKKFCIPAR